MAETPLCGTTRLSVLALVSCALLCAVLLAAEPEAREAAATLLLGVSVVDVERGSVEPDRDVLIVGDRIARVAGQGALQAPEGARIVEGRGLFLMPGLVDAHVHYVDADSYGPLMIAHGVTLVRDMGGPNDATLALRDRLNRREVVGPEMVATGEILDGDPPVWPFSIVCKTAEEGRQAVRSQAARHVDQIKVYSRLPKEAYIAIVEEAHKLGLKAVGHVPAAVTLEEAMQAGQDEEEHLIGFSEVLARLAGKPVERAEGVMEASPSGWLLYPEVGGAKLAEFLQNVRRSGMVHCPTLVVIKGIASPADLSAEQEPMLDYVPDYAKTIWTAKLYEEARAGAGSALPYMQALVGELHKAGAPLICGTDLAGPHVIAGHSLHEEMAMWQEAGIPASDVLRSATLAPARWFGLDGRLGTVQEGKTASLVLVRANPLEDIRNAKQIEGVFLGGRYLSRADLDGLLQNVRESVRAARATGEKVELSLPGEVIRRGRYVAQFKMQEMSYDAGSEDFLITKAADGYHLMAHSRPTSGFQAPYVVTVHVGPDFGFRSAQWRQLSEGRIEASYTATDGRIRAEATQAGKPLPAQELDLPVDAVVGAPSYSADFLTVGLAGLEVGQKRDFQSVSFGYPSWQLQVAPLELARQPDEQVTRRDGTQVKARLYTSHLKIPIGDFLGQLWTDEAGVVLKSTLKMPFGEIHVALE